MLALIKIYSEIKRLLDSPTIFTLTLIHIHALIPPRIHVHKFFDKQIGVYADSKNAQFVSFISLFVNV
jgi:hypothetical protein